jgi:hypothetical protein
MSIERQARMMGLAWERIPNPRPKLTLEIYSPSGEKHLFYLGPHAPHLTQREIALLHKVWLELSRRLDGQDLHHHDVVYFALREVEREIAEGRADLAVQRLRRDLSEHGNQPHPD